MSEAARTPPAVVVYDRDTTGTPVVDLRVSECVQWAEQHGANVLAICVDVRPAALDDGEIGVCLTRPEMVRAVNLLHLHPDAMLLVFREERISNYGRYLDEVVRALDSRVLVGPGRQLMPNPRYGNPMRLIESSAGEQRDGG